MQTFAAYSDARAAGERVVRELANGSQTAALTATQSRDALTALERLQTFYQSTGRRVSLLAGISEYCEASAKLSGRTLGEAVTGYLRTVVSVKRKDIKEAVEEFLQADAPRTKAVNGQRAQLAADYATHRKLQLRRFAATFPSTPVCDLSKEHLDAFINSLADFAPKIATITVPQSGSFCAGRFAKIICPSRIAWAKPMDCAPNTRTPPMSAFTRPVNWPRCSPMPMKLCARYLPLAGWPDCGQKN